MIFDMHASINLYVDFTLIFDKFDGIYIYICGFLKLASSSTLIFGRFFLKKKKKKKKKKQVV